MARPRIVSETRRQPEVREPPSAKEISPHDWLSKESMADYRHAVAMDRPLAMYLSSAAERKIREHALREARRRLEVMGFLLGEVYSWKDEVYTIVRDVGTTHLKSTSAKVRFDPKAFPKLFAELDDSGFDYILTGWYHSHPGHTCFLSRTDLDTQRTMFDQPYHTAIVIDPLNQEIKAFRLAGESYEEISFAVIEAPAKGRSGFKSVRTRKLKIRPVVEPTGSN